jgi:hypothetical protein
MRCIESFVRATNLASCDFISLRVHGMVGLLTLYCKQVWIFDPTNHYDCHLIPDTRDKIKIVRRAYEFNRG